jgi:hypothetical protein
MGEEGKAGETSKIQTNKMDWNAIQQKGEKEVEV